MNNNSKTLSLVVYLLLSINLAALLICILKPEILINQAKPILKEYLLKTAEEYIDSNVSEQKSLNQIVAEYKTKQAEIDSFIRFGLPFIVSKMIDQKMPNESGISKLLFGIERQANLFIDQFIPNITQILSNKFDTLICKLNIELKKFFGINCVFLVIALLFLFFPKDPGSNTVSGILVFSTLLSSLFYIFGQDWFYLIIFDNYLGYYYALVLFLISLLMFDLKFNRGRVIRFLFNGIR